MDLLIVCSLESSGTKWGFEEHLRCWSVTRDILPMVVITHNALEFTTNGFNSLDSVGWRRPVGFQTRFEFRFWLSSYTSSSLAGELYALAAGRSLVWYFFQQTSIAFTQHSHTFTQCSSSNFPGTRCPSVRGEPDTRALKFQLCSWLCNTAFKDPHISKELKIILAFPTTDISGSRLDVSL